MWQGKQRAAAGGANTAAGGARGVLRREAMDKVERVWQEKQRAAAGGV